MAGIEPENLLHGGLLTNVDVDGAVTTANAYDVPQTAYKNPRQAGRRAFTLAAAAVVTELTLNACAATPDNKSSTSETQPFAQEAYTGYFSAGETNNPNLQVAVTLSDTSEILSTPDGNLQDNAVSLSDIQAIAGTKLPSQKVTNIQITGKKIGVVTRLIGVPTGQYDQQGNPIITDQPQRFIELPATVKGPDGKIHNGSIYIRYNWATPPVSSINSNGLDVPTPSPTLTSIKNQSNTSSGINDNLRVSWN